MERPGFVNTLSEVSRSTVEVPSLRVVVRGEGGKRITAPLGLDGVVVGGGEEADLVVEDARVSRRHCEVRLTGEGVVLRDLGSKNGTRVGAIAVREAVLGLEAHVTIGSSELWVERAGAPEMVELSEEASFGAAVGDSVPMRRLFEVLGRVAPRDVTVLLLGETGTGKEVLARAIHEASPRKKRPFVVLDCGAVDAGLLSAELFGHERGAFTGAAGARRGKLAEADGGTLFIDEIGELPLDLQPKLLRALQSKEFTPLGASRPERFDARVVSATHRNLKKLVEDGKFRQDLFFRLSVVVATIPPLRDRSGDIPLLVTRLLEDIGAPLHLSDLPRGVLDVLRSYSWPGNVRELRNVLERLVALPDEPLDLVDSALPASLRGGASAAGGAPAGRERGGEALSWDPGLAALPLAEARGQVQERFLRWYLTAVLRECDGTVTRAALRMGVNRQYLHNLIRRCGLARGDFRDDDP